MEECACVHAIGTYSQTQQKEHCPTRFIRFLMLLTKVSKDKRTSVSSPAAAGMFSLINDRRLNQGTKPLGFLNPLLYGLADQYPDAFFDITKGKNNCN
ncbi:unnamed protein product [Didymodactylos carnosus]|uniref:Subtilisin n=1 Tax=Didymodactylos carnosus TaxID=1234261 RepID=A0A815YUC5_9BILA|nr:unnamed protein product [Didymodactylos carnosus]CAF4438709.1 unnamed protein product [Didymodactylos carnosus]